MSAPSLNTQERQTDSDLFASLIHYIYNKYLFIIIVLDQLHTTVFYLPAKTTRITSTIYS